MLARCCFAHVRLTALLLPAQAKEIMYHKANLNRIMAECTGQPVERVRGIWPEGGQPEAPGSSACTATLCTALPGSRLSCHSPFARGLPSLVLR